MKRKSDEKDNFFTEDELRLDSQEELELDVSIEFRTKSPSPVFDLNPNKYLNNINEDRLTKEMLEKEDSEKFRKNYITENFTPICTMPGDDRKRAEETLDVETKTTQKRSKRGSYNCPRCKVRSQVLYWYEGSLMYHWPPEGT